MREKGSGVDKRSANPHDNSPAPLRDDSILQFGILCCVVTMVIVLAVAVAAA
jgi:hypothetical protein